MRTALLPGALLVAVLGCGLVKGGDTFAQTRSIDQFFETVTADWVRMNGARLGIIAGR